MRAPDHVPYRLLGSSGRARLQQRLEMATRRWLDTWTPKDTVTAAIRLEADDKPLPRVLDPLAESYRICANGARSLDVRVFPRGLTAVVGVLPDRWSSGPGAPRANGLAAQLSAALLRSLVDELMDSASITAWRFEEPARPQGERAKRALSQRALVSVADRDLAEIELAPDLVNALVPAGNQPSAGHVESRRGSIGKARVKVDAVLGNVEMSVADFLSIDRGDVIVLGERLGQGCRVQIPTVAAVAEAVVGKRGDHRAVRIRRTEPGARAANKIAR
jgi:flagellar motor switch/type III secretory pathway protein FliN